MGIFKDLGTLDLFWGQMEEELRSLCAGMPGVLGYDLLEIESGRRISFRERAVFPTASTIKIFVLLGLSFRVFKGDLKWENRILVGEDKKVGGSGILTHLKYPVELSIWDLASLMIALSDNTATNICIDLAKMDFVNDIADDLGLSVTRLNRMMIDLEAAKRGEENVSAPYELVEVLRRIQERDGVEEPVAEDVLKILSLPKTGPFKKGIPEGIKYINKPGGLGNLSADAGIIYLPQKTFIFAVMGAFLEGIPEDSTALVVKKAYRYMAILDRCTILGRS